MDVPITVKQFLDRVTVTMNKYNMSRDRAIALELRLLGK